MSTPEYILTTTGFIVQKSPHFEALSPEKIRNTSIFNRSTFNNADADIDDYTKNKLIYHCKEANVVYKEYTVGKTFDQFMRMVNLFLKTIAVVPFKTFLEQQATNRNLSATMFMYCTELAGQTLNDSYIKYTSLPGTARLVPNTVITYEDLERRVRLLKTMDKEGRLVTSNQTWERVLPEIISAREPFVNLFKQTMVDVY